MTAYAGTEIGIEHQTWVMAQDKNGTYRFGTRGLASFDGQRWDVTPMQGAQALRGLDVAPDGRIWAGAIGEIGWFEPHAEGLRYHSLVASLPAAHRELGEVFYAFAERDGAVFVTDRKILRWTGHAFQIWERPGTRRLFACRSGGTIFVHHKITGVWAMRESGPELIIPAADIGDFGVFWLQRHDNNWLLVTSRGLMRWSRDRLQELDHATNETIIQASLTSVADIGDGRLALGTGRRGILIVSGDGRLLQKFAEAEGVPTNNVYGVFIDRDRQLWGTSASHVFRVNLDSVSQVFTQQAGVPAGRIRHLEVSQGRTFAVANDSLHVLSADAERFAPQMGFPDYTHIIRTTPRGTLLGTIRGVKRLEGNVATSIYSNDRDVFLIEPSRLNHDHLLIAEASEIRQIAPDGTAFTRAGGLPDIATSIAEDNDGRLWLGTISRGVLTASPDGTVVRDAVRDIHVPVAISGPSTALATDAGDILIFTTAGGWIKAPGAATFSSIEGFPRRETLATSPTRDRSNLWLVLAKSDNRPSMIGQVIAEDSRAVWRPHAVDGIESIGSPHSIFAEKRPDQSTVLWIGGATGILRSVVGGGPTAPQPRAPMLQLLARENQNSAPSLVTAALPYSTESIEFRFAAPQFAVRPTLRLETRIDGIDHDWVPAGPAARRELTALRDGRYAFEVRAVADTGVASEITRTTFEVLPPWWRTWPAALGVVLALAPAVYGCYRLRVRTLRRRNAELEVKVRQRTAELEAANAAKTQFVANMSHDIRNPLNGIVGLALALEDTRLEPRQREIVATLRECTTYLSTLVDDVLDFASIEAGRIELRPARYAPAELLGSVVATLRGDTVDRGAIISVELDPELSDHVVGDAGRIQQILVNFVSNALKYAGGEIRIAATLPIQSPGEIEFAVHDRGPGIRPEDHAALFKKFSRLPRPAGSDEVQGSGLGLAVCRLLADRMGGAVGVESAAGAGTRFFLRLPLAVATAPVEAPAAALPNTTVLLVEDTDYNAWAASAVLARLGLACERARTGAEALALFAAKRYNIVLLDRNLPDMDGTEVARQIRELETEGQESLLLAVTAYCTAEDRQLCLDAGMDAFVGKPLTPEKLRKVFVAAGRRKLAAAAVPVPPDFSPAELDLAILSHLTDGSAEGMNAEIRRFVAAMRATEEQLTAASRACDFTQLGTSAHHLHGQATIIGGAALAEATRHLEAAARLADGSACRDWLRQVQREIETLTESMNPSRAASLPA